MPIKEKLDFITEYGYDPTTIGKNSIPMEKPPLPWWYNDVAKCLRSIYYTSSTN